MQSNKIVWLCMGLGSAIGGFIPTLWGDSSLSMSSVLLTAVGGLAGIWLGWRMGE